MKRVILLLLPLVWVSCTKQTLLTEADLKDYISTPENGLVQEQRVNDYLIRVEYYPTDLLLARELRALPEANADIVASLEEKYASYDYYIMSLSKGDKDALYGSAGDQMEFSALLQELSFHMGDYVSLRTDLQDTILVADFIYQRTYGNSAASSLLFAFDNEKVKDCEQFRFHLEEFGLGIGRQQFRFLNRDLNKMPQLAFHQ